MVMSSFILLDQVLQGSNKGPAGGAQHHSGLKNPSKPTLCYEPN